MTELERLLSDSLQELSLQYKEDMQRLELQVQDLQQQVQQSQLATAQQIRDLLQQVASLAVLIEQLE